MNKKRKIAVSLLMFFFCFSVFSNLAFSLTETENQNYSLNALKSPNWRWTDTDLVSSESTNPSQFSDIAVDDFGNVHITWQDETNYKLCGADWDIFYKQWVASNQSWTTTKVVSTESTGPSQHPSIDVDGLGNAYVVWVDLTNYAGAEGDPDIFFKIWNASLSSWTTTEVVSTDLSGESEWPDIDVDSVGNAYVCWYDSTNYDLSGTDYDIFYKKRDINTETFSTTEVVSIISSDQSMSPSMVADEEGNVFIAWHDNTFRAEEDILFNKWNEASSSWVGTEILSTATDMRYLDPDITLDTKGNIHIVWGGYGTGTAAQVKRIFYMQWNEEQNSWLSPSILRTIYSYDISEPNIVTDAGNNIFVTWKYGIANVERDLELIRYDTILNGWIAPTIISPDIIDEPSYHSLTIDKLGHLHIAWYDEIDYLSSDIDRDIFYRKYIGSPTTPTLAVIVPNPTEVSNIGLYWENIYSATNYYIYRSDAQIFSLEGIVPIDSTTNNFYVDPLGSVGYYYYVIVAGNFAGNSSISNCEYVEYKLPSLREFYVTTGLFIAVMITIFIVAQRKKKKHK